MLWWVTETRLPGKVSPGCGGRAEGRDGGERKDESIDRDEGGRSGQVGTGECREERGMRWMTGRPENVDMQIIGVRRSGVVREGECVGPVRWWQDAVQVRGDAHCRKWFTLRWCRNLGAFGRVSLNAVEKKLWRVVASGGGAGGDVL